MKKNLFSLIIFVGMLFVSNQFFAQAPTVEASNTQLSYKWPGTAASITWTRGNGQNCMVVMRKNSSSGTVPSNNTTNYSASASYGSGSLVNGVADNNVIYKGTGTGVYVYNLTANTLYDVYVYEYNSITIFGTTTFYYNTNYSQSALAFSTAAVQPSSCGSVYTATSITNSSATIWSTAGNGNGRLITVSLASTSASNAIQGYYYAPSTVYGSGANVGGAYAVYDGTASNVNVTGLAGATTYKAYDYEYNNGTYPTSSYNYNTRNYMACNTYTFNTTNIPPTISSIPSMTICQNAGTQYVNLSGITDGSTNETQSIHITATSSNTVLINNLGVNYSNPNTTGQIKFYPNSGQYGTSVITLTLDDNWSVNNITTVTFTVTVLPKPGAAGPISGLNPICAGSSQSYSISPTSNTTAYTWSIPSGFSITSGTTTNAITVSTTSATTSGNIYVYPVNTNGCGNGSSSGLSVQVDQQPADPNAGPDQPLICIGNAFLNATAVSNPDAGQWSWLSGTPVPSIGTTTVNSTSISGLISPNTYKYIWTVTRAGSVCPSKTDTVSITTNWASGTCQPAAGFSFGPNSDVSNNSVCLGSATNFNDISISADQWQWDFTYNGSIPNFTSTSQNPSYTYGSVGTYTVYLRIYSNATSQYYNTTQVIHVIDAPAAPSTIFGTTSGICAGNPNQYVYSISNVTNATSYNWNVPTGAGIAAYPSLTSIAATYSSNAVSGYVTVSAANSCGTSTATALSVTVNPLPDVAIVINGSSSVCQAQTNVTYSVNAIANAVNYIWTDINGTQTTTSSTSATYSFSATATSGTISVQGSNACGTGLVTTLPITVNPLPDAANSIIGLTNITICPNPGNIMYVVPTINNATSYNWLFPTGITVVGGNSKDTMQVSVSNLAGGNQQISVNGLNACGNGAAANLSVFVNTPSTPQICMVTVDSLSTHNIIYWDKTMVTGADSFKIYRENSTNIYTQIGTVSYHALSEYHDFGVDPNSTTTHYKISAIDSCGNESAKSNYHNTLYIVNAGLGQFTWAQLYTIENTANPVSNYVLMRDSNNTGVFVPIVTTAGTSNTLNDVNYASYPNANWYVDALGFNCSPTLRLANGGNNSVNSVRVRSHSNQNNNRQSGVNQLGVVKNQITVYPNPSNGNITISNSQKINELKVTDVIGNVVYETKSAEQKTELHLENSGVYFITVISGKEISIKKVVITN